MELLNFKSPVLFILVKKDWPEAIFPSGFEVLTPELNAAFVPTPPSRLYVA
jgi:hypothetical protein